MAWAFFVVLISVYGDLHVIGSLVRQTQIVGFVMVYEGDHDKEDV